MRLYEIWNGVPALRTLASLKKNPKLAYLLLKYAKKVDVEMTVCEENRRLIAQEIFGAECGNDLTAKIGTPEFDTYNDKFQEFMQQDSDLSWTGVTLDELINALDAQDGNTLTEDDIRLLEPFFTPITQ